MADEVSKLRTHLDLLREEYVKLQTRLADLEKKYQVALATAGQVEEDNFVSRLLKTVAELFNKELYSDITVKLDGKDLKGHRFVLAARSDYWGVKDLSLASELDISDIPYEVGHALMQWVYTDQIDIRADDGFLLDLLRAGTRFQLSRLADRCEKALMSSVTVKNCIRFYQTAEEIGAEILKEHCSELISNHWNDFTSEDFASMPAPLAYRMFKAKSQYPLHTSIRAHREDVVFLYLVEHDAELPGKLNEIDNQGDLALDLALKARLEGIAGTLVKHKADVNRTDHSGKCLLHKAIARGDEFSAKFLIDSKANVNATTHLDKETGLHMVASFNPEVTGQDTLQGMANTARLLLEHGARVNSQDTSGNSALHKAIVCHNEPVFSVLLNQKELDLELQNSDGETVLWLSLHQVGSSGSYTNESFASRLLIRGSSPNAINTETGDSLLHKASRTGHEAASLFLATHGANGSIANHKGETPLHAACEKGLAKLTKLLLEKGANPNAQTTSSLSNNSDENSVAVKQTPLHIAIANKHETVVKVFLDYKAKVTQGGNNLQIIPNFTLKDSNDQTVLGLALWNSFHDIASQLLSGGANVNDYNSEGLTLLHQAIMKQDASSSLFLLDRQADCNAKTTDGQTCLELAIKRHLPAVVDALCQRGANMNIVDSSGDAPLWMALETGQEDVASTLVRHGCDPDMWGNGPGGCQQTLLHRAIDENNEPVACFLIRSWSGTKLGVVPVQAVFLDVFNSSTDSLHYTFLLKEAIILCLCDVNSPRRPGPNGEGDEEARDGQGPLHMAGAWGLERVVQCLVEHNADVNLQDAEGKTPFHIAIENQHEVIISLLLSHPALDLTCKDKQGLTPFAASMMTKNQKAAQAILNREPNAAELLDNRGRNFLHTAVMKSDIESVLFLISVRANVNSRDSFQFTPLLMGVKAGSEIIVRNLLLAGASINDRTTQKQNSLHLAAQHDFSSIATVLLENSIDFDAVDDSLNNALHIAVQHGHINTVRVLLTESRINAEAVNMKGQTPMHVLGQYGKENAAAIFDLFMECMPQYPIDKPDANGSSVLLLAYINGNGNLCRAVVRAGASLGITNKDGLSIFNAPVATKQLLVKLLDMLSKEPPWCEGEVCHECGVKFGIKTRKHHCRHCGRLLCSKCSGKDMPIIKYNIPKPVRVCEICFDVLTLGTAAS